MEEAPPAADADAAAAEASKETPAAGEAPVASAAAAPKADAETPKE